MLKMLFPPDMKAPRILLVEDDPGVRQLFRTGLALAGFDAEVADAAWPLCTSWIRAARI
jgi:DNA-binding response OmpR family regulator